MTPRRYRWDPALGRYRDLRTGRLISEQQVRSVIDRTLREATSRARLMADDLRSGRISLEVWRSQMRDLVKEVHSYAAASARGGWAAMDASAWGQVGAQVRSEYAYLETFAQQIADGLPLDGRFGQRTLLYAQAGRETFTIAERDVQQRAGADEERNVIDPGAESCAECLSLTADGWVPIGDLPPVGSRTCGRNCRCRIIYRNSEEAMAA